MYYNRDLSWLDFNHRVLQEAANTSVPLYERIKFLAIFSSNLDEFFSIRFPVVAAIANLKLKTRRKIENDVPENLTEQLQVEISKHLKEFAAILEQQIIPALTENGVVLYYKTPLLREHVTEVHELFLSRVLSFLQPVFLTGDLASRFEPEAGKSYLIVSLQSGASEELQHAIIRIPSDILGRFFVLAPVNGKQYVVFVDDVIRDNVRYIFPGFKIVGIYGIKFNRNAELDFEDDYSGDIIKKIERQLKKRSHGIPSRFVYETGMPANVRLYLASVFGVDYDGIFEDGRYQNLKDLAVLPCFDSRLKYKEWKPVQPALISDVANIFRTIEERDVLLHFPYHSYNVILAFFNQAAIDPEVEEIYIALYRIAADSLIANALISAARNGKKVVAFIELMARFDEANNIAWARKMKEAGVRIIYSIPGIKVHSKIALVTRRGNVKRYGIVSTGNFNELTAHFYTDHTLLTTNKHVTAELLQLFQFLERREAPAVANQVVFKTLLAAQFNMAEKFEKLVRAQIKKAESGGNGLIRVKVNNLEEPGIIDLLYRASTAGVTVQLIVRSICCLVPGIAGISDNIHVKRLVGRYLEHTRLFIFGQDDEAEVIMGSSDWMTRNLYHRIEVCVPVTDADCRRQLLDYFSLQWKEDADPNPAAEHTAILSDAESGGQLSIYNYLKERV